MQFTLDTAELFIPDAAPAEQALARTTHLAVSAHQDDIEIMAAGPVVACYRQPERWFSGVVLSDGRGSPREGLYKNYSDDEMRRVRFTEQKQAALVGEYAALALLDYPSRVLKDATDPRPVYDLVAIFRAARPRFVYTHNLADKHDTHVAAALRVITALRRLPSAERPEKLYGCEVWRDLDWLDDADKVAFDLSEHENLQAALLGVFDSQIAGGKRYDVASMGRRRANATYFASHGVDESTALSFAMDLTPLIADDRLDPGDFIASHLARFAQDVSARLQRLG
jgi:LmbE family N-acetylglucosaminyl deacetylase